MSLTHESPPVAADLRASEVPAPDVSRSLKLRRWGVWASTPLIALALVLLVRIVLFEPYQIPSDSMVPTLEDGDRVIVNRLSYAGGEIERGQVVVFDRPIALPGEDDVIKRVVGLPGETVRFENDSVYIDGQRMVEPYVLEATTTVTQGQIPGCAANEGPRRCVVPDGYVFVLGDNRAESIDSRDYGPVPIDGIIGRAVARIWPLLESKQL